MARAYALSCDLSKCKTAEDKARTFRLMRMSLFSALGPKKDGTNPIYNAPLELEVI